MRFFFFFTFSEQLMHKNHLKSLLKSQSNIALPIYETFNEGQHAPNLSQGRGLMVCVTLLNPLFSHLKTDLP